MGHMHVGMEINTVYPFINIKYSDTLRTESDVYDINYREKQAREV